MRDTVDMAREAGFYAMRGHGLLPHVPEDIFIANLRVTEELNHLVALVRADERKQALAAPCTWTKSPDPHMPDTFSSTCGVVWTFTEGGPGENNVRFCPGCSGKLVEGQP